MNTKTQLDKCRGLLERIIWLDGVEPVEFEKYGMETWDARDEMAEHAPVLSRIVLGLLDDGNLCRKTTEETE